MITLGGARRGAWEADEYGWFGIRNQAYFNALETFDSGLSYEVDFEPFRNSNVTNNQSVFGMYYNDGVHAAIRHYNTIGNGTSSTWRFSSYVGTKVTEAVINSRQWRRQILSYDASSKSFLVDGGSYVLSWDVAYLTNFAVYIGCAHNYNTNSSPSDYVGDLTNKMDFYSIKFKRNGVVTREWVGKKIDGVWMPYEKISGTVAVNLGAGYFTGGTISN